MTDERPREVGLPHGSDRQELMLLRRKLEHHRRALADLALTAPGERLGRLYAGLIEEIDTILEQLPAVPYATDAADGPPASPVIVRRGEARSSRAAASRVAVVVGLAALLFAALGALIVWTNRRAEPSDVSVGARSGAKVTPAVEPRIAAFVARPGEFDFGNVRRGGRYVQTFELANESDEPIEIAVGRSSCRCLWFRHDEQIPPRGAIAFVVALDTSQLEPGPLAETIRISVPNRKDSIAEIRIAANVIEAGSRN